MKWLVTGGAGFIGTNVVLALAAASEDVVVLDDLSRLGVDRNADVLTQQTNVPIVIADVSDRFAVEQAFRDFGPFDVILHLAGQVSLMASLTDPRRDFEVNALGTINILESVRLTCPDAVVVGMSSNKAYGDLSSVRFEETSTRFVAPDHLRGFDEQLPLDFHGGYGCSKGTADQYLLDYARTYGMRTVSLRQSSVYGPFQHPRSDQGWVGFLVGEAAAGREIQLHGVGKQVRDLLHVSDLVRLFRAIVEHRDVCAGKPFNVGGGPERSLSILELFAWLEPHLDTKPRYQTGAMRPSDQKVFVACLDAISSVTGWTPRVSLEEGLKELIEEARRDTD